MFHDIYLNKTFKFLNEVISSKIAENELIKIGYSNVQDIIDLILSTKTHLKSDNNDINYFIDADFFYIRSK